MEKELLQKAATIIKNGGLVVFPTETVYGLWSNAFLPEAIQKIYTVKGRAQDNPLIVHISCESELWKIAKNIPETVWMLAEKFWPGPLTLVVEKRDVIPDIVSAGGNTIGVRIPKNDIALELIKLSETPIVAPSANLSGKPSPTNISHIHQDLDGKVDCIIDGGNTDVGLESTVLDITLSPPMLLRPGGVSVEEIEQVIWNIQIHPWLVSDTHWDILKSPGMKYRHYAPEAQLILAYQGSTEILSLIEEYKKVGKKVGVMATRENIDIYTKADVVVCLWSSQKLSDVARNIFGTLREFDTQKVDIILCETFPENGMGMAIMDRLKRASKK